MCEARKFEALLVMTWRATQSKPESRAEAVVAELAKFNATGTPHTFVHPGMWHAAQCMAEKVEKAASSSAGSKRAPADRPK